MFVLKDKRVLVIGLGASGVAACELSCSQGAKVVAVDNADTASQRSHADKLRALGVEVRLGQMALPDQPFELAVLSPGVPMAGELAQEVARREIPLIGELELGWQQSCCRSVAITGTNGKTTTTELVERVLTHNHLKTVAAGNIGLPLCSVSGRTKELDWLTLEVSSFQLEAIQAFRPAVAVLMNITPDHLDRYASMREYAAAKERVFENQRPGDFAVVNADCPDLISHLD